jgi:hypothetical protein
MLFGVIAAGISVWVNLTFGGLSILLAGLLAAHLGYVIVSKAKRASGKKHRAAKHVPFDG